MSVSKNKPCLKLVGSGQLYVEKSLPFGLSFALVKGAHLRLSDSLSKKDSKQLWLACVQMREAISAFEVAKKKRKLSFMSSKIYMELSESLITDAYAMLKTASYLLESELKLI